MGIPVSQMWTVASYVLRQKFAGREPLPIPTEAVDWLDFQGQKGALRWEFLTRNYKTVWDYIAGHGNGIRNTAIFCAMMPSTRLARRLSAQK